MSANYYEVSTRKGLLAEAVVTLTLLKHRFLKLGYESAPQKLQFEQDIDIIGRFNIHGRVEAEHALSIKSQEAGASYGTKGEFGFELYEVRASDGEREEKPFYLAPDDKLIAILQGGKVYLFSMGTLRQYLELKSGHRDRFLKVRGLTEKLKQQLADCNYRYSDTVSGYIDVADFLRECHHDIIIMRVGVAPLEAAELLSQAPISLEALRDTAFTVSLLNFTITLTKEKTKATSRVMVGLLAEVTNLYA